MTELVIVMPVIALFFAAVFYFGFGTNQKIENAMAVRHAAFAFDMDRGRAPDQALPAVTEDQLRERFFTRGREVRLTQSIWTQPQTEVGAFDQSSFSDTRSLYTGSADWQPNDLAATTLEGMGLPTGAHSRTETTITLSGVGFGDPLNLGGKTVASELYVDQKTRKLGSPSLDYDPSTPFDPATWDEGYLPILADDMLIWDWDFASNCFSDQPLDTPWPMNPC